MTGKQSDILRLTVGLMVLLLANAPLSVAAFDEIDAPTDANHNWPHWRGPLATGVAPHGDPPTLWSESKNVRWKNTTGRAGPFVTDCVG